MSEKLHMQTPNQANENFKKLAALFPNAVTETINEDGEVIRAIDKDILMQEINTAVVEGRDFRYQFTWPEKNKAIAKANETITDTLRPDRDSSLNFETTKNLYIEGNNFEVLKLLQENYLRSIKMIYIDPPYNTGSDFVYHDDFSMSADEYLAISGDIDNEGNRMVQNTESNGRFHTDWLNMIYPRLKVARRLLSDDGVIFISISEEEVHNLKKICDEVFGASNFRNVFISRRHDKNLNRQFMGNGLKSFNVGYEYILCYANADFLFNPVFKAASEERQSQGYWKGFWNDADRPTMRYDILGFTPTTGQWKWSKDVAMEAVANYQEYIDNFSSEMTLEEYWVKTGKSKRFIRRNPNGKGKNMGVENWIAPTDEILRTTNWTDLLTTKSDPSCQGLFDFPKNVDLIKLLIQSVPGTDFTVLDFFSGSGTTAQAVMQLNSEDNGTRKFIMVQLQEATNKESDAFKKGYFNICEIGKERIRRAGKQIKDSSNDKTLDVGFRVLKLDSSNMEDVFYTPQEVITRGLWDRVDNIKPDRTREDLLFQSMLELDVTLSARIAEETIGDKKVFVVEDGYIIACFDQDLTDEIIEDIAKRQPYYFVTRDSSLADDSVAVNFEQLFKSYSPKTVIKVL